jgi:hypothetical protein
MTHLKGRAGTEAEKRAIIERLLAAWLRAPRLRLGQLLEAAVSGRSIGGGMFYVEDDDLLDCVELLVEKL